MPATKPSAFTEPTHDPVHGARFAFCAADDDLLVVDTWLEPGGVLPEHLHPRQLEIWWSLAGTGSFTLDGARSDIGPDGGRVRIDPGVRHSVANDTGEEIHLRAEVRPPLRLQRFLEEAAAAARERRFRRGGIPTSFASLLWLARMLDRYREDVVLTRPPPALQRLALPPLLALASVTGDNAANR